MGIVTPIGLCRLVSIVSGLVGMVWLAGCTSPKNGISITTTVPFSHKEGSGSPYCTGSASGDAYAQRWTGSMSPVYTTCGDRTGNTYFIIGGKWYYTVGAVPAG